MKTAKAVCLLALGVVLGALVPSLGSPLNAQRQAATPGRITVVNLPPVGSSYSSFLKDTKSGGCWLQVALADATHGTSLALAVAPPSACE